MKLNELWDKAIQEHNFGKYHEAHELFEDLWLELDNRQEKDILQTLAQADALAVHIETENTKAAQRLMRQLPELITTFPPKYKGIDLKGIKCWINEMIKSIPRTGKIKEIKDSEPPKLI